VAAGGPVTIVCSAVEQPLLVIERHQLWAWEEVDLRVIPVKVEPFNIFLGLSGIVQTPPSLLWSLNVISQKLEHVVLV
jgi:hypothetical protein